MPRARYRTRYDFHGYLPAGVKWLLISNAAVFLLCYFGGASLQRYVLAWLTLSAQAAVACS